MNAALAVTNLRIVAVPFVILALYLADWLAALLFAVVSLTDWLDGYLARKYNQVSDLGKFLDPLADKLLVISVLIVLAVQLRVDVFSVVFLTAREFVIMGVRSLAASKGVIIAASPTAKYKTAVQMVAIFLLLARWPFGLVLYYGSLLLAVGSLVEYIWQNRQIFKG